MRALVALTGAINRDAGLSRSRPRCRSGPPLLYLNGDFTTNMARAIQGSMLGALVYKWPRSMRESVVDRKWFSLAEAGCLATLLLSTFLWHHLSIFI